MLDVVTANENEPTTPIDRSRINHRKPQLTVACCPEPDSTEATAVADQPKHQDNQQSEQKRDEQRASGYRQIEHGFHRCHCLLSWPCGPLITGLMRSGRPARSVSTQPRRELS